MKGKRLLLSRLVSAVGLTRFPRRLGPQPRLLALTYHRVLEADLSTYPLYPDVVDVSPDDFDRQMALVSRHFTPVVASDIASMIDGGRPWPRHPVAITFDDGYKDNLTTALPILQKHGLRATFFVTAAPVERHQLFWWDYIWYTVRHCTGSCLRINYPRPAVFQTDSLEARRFAAESLITMVKASADINLVRLKEDLAEASRVEVPESQLCEKNVATWDDIQSLVSAGMEVGSHSLTHRVLSRLPPAVLAHELSGSKSLLQERLGVQVGSLAYPAGGVTTHVCRAVMAAGFSIAFGPPGRADRVDRVCRYRVHREATGANEPYHLFRSMLMIPQVFTLRREHG